MTQSFFFNCRGHPAITAVHPTTLEVTKDLTISIRGDCIVGVKADFKPRELQMFLEGAKGLKIILSYNGKSEVIRSVYNPLFRAYREIVIRRSSFASDRTLAIGTDRACIDLSRDFVEMIKNPKVTITVEIRQLRDY